MKITLFAFQQDALHQFPEKVEIPRKYWSSDNPQAITFTAPRAAEKPL